MYHSHLVVQPSQPARMVGRYALYDPFASGGMATVHFGRLVGAVGFARTVAIKRLRPALAEQPEFVAMFLDEAHIVSRIRHPNVVPTLDVVSLDRELFLVMDYVHGESLARLLRAERVRGQRVAQDIAVTIIVNVLHGLHASHETRNERGELLGIVHRDVSPQNVLVGTDGVARVLDFGIAKAVGRLQSTREGEVKGKFAYMAPEQMNGAVSQQTDIYSCGVVLWEALTGQALFPGATDSEIALKVLGGRIEPPTRLVPEIGPELDAIVMKALQRDPGARFATAREMAKALEDAIPLAPSTRVGEWVESRAAEALATRAQQIREIERSLPLTHPTELGVASVSSTAHSGTPDESSPGEPVITSTRPSGGSSRVRVAVAAASISVVGLVLALVAFGTRASVSERPALASSGDVVVSPEARLSATAPTASSEPSASTAPSRVGPNTAPSHRPLVSKPRTRPAASRSLGELLDGRK